ncbi:unnamed protein product, partial [Prorocentrum cordatum]
PGGGRERPAAPRSQRPWTRPAAVAVTQGEPPRGRAPSAPEAGCRLGGQSCGRCRRCGRRRVLWRSRRGGGGPRRPAGSGRHPPQPAGRQRHR